VSVALQQLAGRLGARHAPEALDLCRASAEASPTQQMRSVSLS
jgi:hypothetical protein